MGRYGKRKRTKTDAGEGDAAATFSTKSSRLRSGTEAGSPKGSKENAAEHDTSDTLYDKGAATNTEARSATPSQYNRHTFETNSLDHCETPLNAYQHITPLLQHIANSLHVQTAKLRIWDPYYCDGTVKRHLSTCGYDHVVHENVDFYQRIEEGDIPPHDVLVTNPPYSADHIERLLEFVTTKNNNRPFCLLMPNWVARKKEYSSLIGGNNNLFYLSPIDAYTYTMPSWNEKPGHVSETTGQTTPYLSSWYICLNKNNNESLAMEHRLDEMAKRQKPPVWVVAKTIKGLKWKIQKANKKKK